MDEEYMDSLLEEILRMALPDLHAVVVDLLGHGQTKDQIMERVKRLAPGSIIDGIVDGAIRHLQRSVKHERRGGPDHGREAGSSNGRH